MPRVLLVHYTTPPVVGGVERVLARHARLLAGEGFEAHVVTGRGGPVGRGVRLHRLPCIDSRNRRVLAVTRELEAGRVTPAFHGLVARIREDLRHELAGADICIVHNALVLHKNLALTAALHQLAPQGSTRFVAWCHDLAWTNPQYRPHLHAGAPWSLLRTAIPGVTYVAVSTDGRRELAALLGVPKAQIEIVPNGVDPAAFLRLTPTGRWLAAALRLWEQQVVLLLPVRITRRKQIEYALHVVAELVRRELAVRLLITGPPGAHTPGNRAYLDELRGVRHRLGLDDQVVFCADLPGPRGGRLRLSDRTMADLYLLADALILPSRREGFGLPLLEAALARLPAWTSDLPPLREVGGDAIHTFDLADPPAAVALRLIHTLMEERGYRLRRRVLASYTWEGIMRERIIPLLTRLVGAARP
ncbi:MAG TPA: glycosyltransferase family 4 protein [bacterium]|nr:glycosyltransferase family 4 protein [bacterium]